MKKYIITIVTVTLVVLTVALGGFYYLTKDDKATTPNSSNQKQDSKTSTTKDNNKNKNDFIFNSSWCNNYWLGSLFQKFQLGYDKPFPEIMHIQVGNIAISLATFSLVIAIYFTVKREYKSALFSFIGVMLAMSTSALSGAHGGWVGLPIVLLTILFLYRQYISKKLIFLFD